MNEHERMIARLYGEQNDSPEPQFDSDEYAALVRMKARLDGRPRRSPDPATVRSVLDIAQMATDAKKRRPAVYELSRARYWMSAAAAIVLLLGGGLWYQFSGSGGGRAAADGVPAWDDDADLRSIQWRVEAMSEQTSGLAWDEPAIPLEMVPLESNDPAFPQHEAKFEW